MRYYEYLSMSKIEMLYPQINRHSARSAGGEIGFDVKVVKISRQFDGNRETTTHEKLQEIEDWIYAHEPVGNIDEPKAWIYGRTTLASTVVDMAWNHPGPDPRSGAILYAGRSDTGALILLGGSARHLVGAPESPVTDLQGWEQVSSHGPNLRMLLARFHRVFEDPDRSVPDADAMQAILQGPTEYRRWHERQVIALPARAILGETVGRYLGDTDIPASPFLMTRGAHCEFLAKRLHTVLFPGMGPVTLATPLFVALAD